MSDLAGKTALVTGANGGIGREIAKALAAVGAQVVLTGRSEDGLRAVKESLSRDGYSARIVVADLASREGCRKLASECGDVDILINNAAVLKMSNKKIVEESDEYWDENISTNFIAPVTLIQALAPAMAERGSGAIVNISSVVAYRSTPLVAPYATTKAALEHLTRIAAMELSPQGVRVNAIRCGLIETDSLRAFLDETGARDALISQIPAARLVQPPEVARLCAFLVSDDAQMITGSVYTIDGGLTSGQYSHW